MCVLWSIALTLADWSKRLILVVQLGRSVLWSFLAPEILNVNKLSVVSLCAICQRFLRLLLDYSALESRCSTQCAQCDDSF